MDKGDALPDHNAPAGGAGVSTQVALLDGAQPSSCVARGKLVPKQRKTPNHGWQSRLVVHRPPRRVIDLPKAQTVCENAFLFWLIYGLSRCQA